METKTINLREVPEELVRKAKMYAALKGLTLKELILRSLRETLSRAEGELAGATIFFDSTDRPLRIRKGKKRKR